MKLLHTCIPVIYDALPTHFYKTSRILTTCRDQTSDSLDSVFWLLFPIKPCRWPFITDRTEEATVRISHPTRVRAECARALINQVSCRPIRMPQARAGGARLRGRRQQPSGPIKTPSLSGKARSQETNSWSGLLASFHMKGFVLTLLQWVWSNSSL